MTSEPTVALPRSGGGAQFIKYALCGGLATAVDMGVFFFLSIFVLQAVQPDDPMLLLLEGIHGIGAGILPGLFEAEWVRRFFFFNLPFITERRRLVMFIVNKTVAFLLANLAAYLSNIKWVFQSGRHSRRKEVGLFYLVSGISYVAGLLLAWLLIDLMGMPTSLTYGALIVASVLINFVCRKYFIFGG